MEKKGQINMCDTGGGGEEMFIVKAMLQEIKNRIKSILILTTLTL